MDGVSSPSLDVNRSRARSERELRVLQCRDSLTACTVRASARSPSFSSQPPLRLAARTRRPAPAPPDGARLGPPPRCGERRPLLLRAALLPPPPLAPPPPLDSRRRCLYSHACCDQAAPRLRAPLGARGRGDARSRRLGGGADGGDQEGAQGALACSQTIQAIPLTDAQLGRWRSVLQPILQP